MTLDTFYEHFELLADAPNVVQKLREMVLQLAVRGKLVEQEKSDEPARVFLSSIPPSKPNGELHMIRESEKPFEVPQTWEWVRFADVAEFRAGKTPSRKDSRFWADGVYPWVSIADMKHGKTLYETKEQVSEIAESEVFRGAISPGGTLLMSFKLTIGKMSILDVDAFHNEAIISIYPHYEVLRDYFFRCLNGFNLSAGNKDAIKGKTLNRQSLSSIVLAVPPENEIARILSKYDELMALCDDLEHKQQARAKGRSRLNTAVLMGLSSAPDERSFKRAWERVGSAFDTLYSTPETIINLRKTILQLAVQGKLVRQDSDDEPAEKLLATVRDEQNHLAGAKQKAKSFLDVRTDENGAPFSLPSSWKWVSLDEVSNNVHYGYTASADHSLTDVRLLRITDIQDNKVHWESVPGCSIEPKKVSAYELEEGDILIARTGGTIGKSYLVENLSVRALFASYLIRVIPTFPFSPRYLKIFLETNLYWGQLYAKSMGTGQPNVNATSLKSLKLPVPPLLEQKRIVAKVDGLMALVDELEAGLSRARGDSERLLGAVIQSLLSSETKQVVEA